MVVSKILVQWHWKVFLTIEYWSYLDIPNLRNVKFSSEKNIRPFRNVQCRSISSIDWLTDLIWFIVISITLYRIVPLSKNELQTFDKSVTSIIIPNWTCNDIDYTIFDFSRYSIVESIEIGDDCFESVKTFKIDGLNRLKTIKIGYNSFPNKKNIWDYDVSKSFHILNCKSLESIQIGEFSFNEFAGEFELKNLPHLQSIQIGTIGNWSYNFYHSSFVIRGIELILNIVMIRSSKSTIHYIRLLCIPWILINNNRKYWMNSNEMIWIDLPSLQSITLGLNSLSGRDDSCSLIMRSTNEMVRNDRM